MQDSTWNAALEQVLKTVDARIAATPQPAGQEALRRLREDLLLLLRPQL
jgi:hypothetical protein